MANSNATYQDIANYTGFSKTTISRYFNRPESVTEENREKISHALEVLNYQSNKVARILARGRTEFIGIIVPNMYMSFYDEILDQFLKTYDKYGYKFIVFSSNGNEESERQYISELLSYHVEGLVMLSHTIPSFELSSYGVPIVGIEREDLYISSVNTDNLEGAAQATRLLCDAGCEVLLHINKEGDDDRTPAHRRIDGFLKVCRERNITHRVFTYGQESDYQDLQQRITVLVDDILTTWPGWKKGLFCSSDSIANIVLNDLFRRFGQLPPDFRIIGFDGSSLADQSVLPLSTVEQQVDQLVDSAMDLLVSQIRERKEPEQNSVSEPVHRTIAPVLRQGATV